MLRLIHCMCLHRILLAVHRLTSDKATGWGRIVQGDKWPFAGIWNNMEQTMTFHKCTVIHIRALEHPLI